MVAITAPIATIFLEKLPEIISAASAKGAFELAKSSRGINPIIEIVLIRYIIMVNNVP